VDKKSGKKKGAKLRFSKEEAIKLLNDLFEFHGKGVILEPIFREYFRKFKNLTDEEINDLIFEGRYDHKIIMIGAQMMGNKVVLAIWRPEDLGEPSVEEQEKIDEFLRRRRKGVFAVEL